jgi:hypothetical protein
MEGVATVLVYCNHEGSDLVDSAPYPDLPVVDLAIRREAGSEQIPIASVDTGRVTDDHCAYPEV